MSTTQYKKFRTFEYQHSCLMDQKYHGEIQFTILDGLIGNTPTEVCNSLIIKAVLSNPLANFSFEKVDSFKQLHKVEIVEFEAETEKKYGYINFVAMKTFRLVRPNSNVVKIDNSLVLPNMEVEIEKQQVNGRNVIRYAEFNLRSSGMGLKQDGMNYFKQLESVELPAYRKEFMADH